MGHPTEKQIDYAAAIANALGIDGPEFTFEAHMRFISRYKQEYHRHINYVGAKNSSEGFLLTQLIDLEWLADNLTNVCGLYAFASSNTVIYIGKSQDLAARIPSSFNERNRHTRIDQIYYLPTPNMADAHILEIMLITEYAPILNSDCKTTEKSTLFESGLNIFRDFKELPKPNGGTK